MASCRLVTGHVSRASSAASGESTLPAVLQAALSLGSPSADVLCSQAISPRPGSASLEEALFSAARKRFFFRFFQSSAVSESSPLGVSPLRPSFAPKNGALFKMGTMEFSVLHLPRCRTRQ